MKKLWILLVALLVINNIFSQRIIKDSLQLSTVTSQSDVKDFLIQGDDDIIRTIDYDNVLGKKIGRAHV